MGVLEIRNLDKSYGSVKALDQVNLDIDRGIVGLLGNNGAGKSTLIKILVTLLDPDRGNVLYQGTSITEKGETYRKILGYMPQQQSLYKGLTVRGFLSYTASLKGLHGRGLTSRITELLEALNLSEKANHRLDSLSGGMRQRALIAQALLNDPEVLILDEPTAGLDPLERRNFRDILVSLSADRLILLATHLVSDIEYVANQLVFLKKGTVCASGAPSVLASQTPAFESFLPLPELKERYRDFKLVNRSSLMEGVLVRFVSHEAEATSQVVSVRPQLEDIYMDLLSE